MHLREYLDRAINECERGIWILDFQLKIDEGYVASSDADPTDVEYYRCQVELQVVEKECLERKLTILKKWCADPRSPASHLRSV